MRCGWGPYFRRTFEVQAGNSPLQGQSKPPAKLVVLIEMSERCNISPRFSMKFFGRCNISRTFGFYNTLINKSEEATQWN